MSATYIDHTLDDLLGHRVGAVDARRLIRKGPPA
jgi:hypothetical protein